jgi:broad specificity phosphatase PhoE
VFPVKPPWPIGDSGLLDSPAVQQVLIVRHGESTWNVERRWQGWLDAPLTDRGESQASVRARALAHEGVNPRVVYSSDLSRARRTAEIIAAHLEVPVVPDEGFRERHGGEWQGHTGDEIEAAWPGMREQWRRGELTAPPGGETDDQVLARFDEALQRALAHVGSGLLVIVTHHGMLRVVATRAGMDVHALIPNLGGYWFDVEHGSLHSPQPLGAVVLDGEHAALE